MATSVKVVERDRGFKRISFDFKELKDRSVKIGIMGSETADGVSVIDYAMYNEFGTSRIPARPFMAKTSELYKDKTIKFMEFLVGKMIDGRISPDAVLNNLGMKYQSYMQKTIRDAKNWAVPNADSTIAMKGSSSPLIDTGRMIGAVSYEVT